LNSLEPKKLDPAKGRFSNPGLESLPSGFGLDVSKSADELLITPENTRRDWGSNEEIASTFSLSDIIVTSTTETKPDFFSEIDQVAVGEESRTELLSSDPLRSDYRWLNHTIESLDAPTGSRHEKVAWNEDRSFDLTTLPYTTLDDIEDASVFSKPPAS